MGENGLPPRGKFADLGPGLSPEWEEFTGELRNLIRCIDLSYREIAKRAYTTKNVLSSLVSGKRKRAPEEQLLKALHDLAVARVGADGILPWEDFNSLRQALTPLATTNEGPQPVLACPDCGAPVLLDHVMVADRPAESLAAITADVVPVPRPGGDRHNSRAVDVSWPPAQNLAVYITAGNYERANGLIRHVGSEAIPTDAADAVVSCRDLGMLEATDAIISYAAGRESKDDVLHIVHLLIQRNRRDDAETLVERAVAN